MLPAPLCYRSKIAITIATRTTNCTHTAVPGPWFAKGTRVPLDVPALLGEQAVIGLVMACSPSRSWPADQADRDLLGRLTKHVHDLLTQQIHDLLTEQFMARLLSRQ
ncbi:hypothetical protein PCASD_17990 [Puccinia coronata f. sp. avenae]|uniref:Uncharacterized protein n=1 Tax=Puccinia coronata f. sp. avenae TaxID=200324 RepID=A0A2N5RZ76_9BASI|nr:hypothetical protein PCASD_22935 [Puccinia coronata f. sp. avenae]PLW33335.1 hypothetical protein PCASD_17990 [Puccinia coronata f. sp. avenae]